MRKEVEKFLNGKNYAIVGVSVTKSKFGNAILKEMAERGFTMYPVHRTAESLEGIKCYNSIKDLPQNIEGIILVIPPVETEKIVKEIAALGIKQVWMQQGSSSEKAVKYCKENGINVISKECILMFLEKPGFPHNFHKWVWGLIGRV